MLDSEVLKDCLLAMGAIAHIEITELIEEAYYGNLKDLDNKSINKAFSEIISIGKWASVERVRELATGISKNDDWFALMSCVNDSTKTTTISGISEQALIKATAARSTIGALRFLVDADSFQISQVRKDWERLVSIAPDPNALPPASVEVSLTLKESPKNKPSNWREDPDYLDESFSERAAAMMRQIKIKGAISQAWESIIDGFPAEKRREVYSWAAANNFALLGKPKSKFYQRAIGTAKEVKSIDEIAINSAIRTARGNEQNALV
jgi:hypothetical protein